jgi:membrane protein DedA with SNARE-associated domain
MATLRITRPEGRHTGWDSIGALLWVLVLGIVALYAFFVALGAFAPGDVIPLSALVAVLVVLYGRHAWREAHRPEGQDPDLLRARERRGF